ncbi:MAG: DNA glycosylase AlkZ-like family protein [Actinomycetota bacterium]
MEVTTDPTPALLLARDEKAFSSPPEPRGIRLLPVQYPYLQQRDRAMVLDNEGDRRKLWRPVRGPGGVLVDGRIVGTWRVRTKGQTPGGVGRVVRPHDPRRSRRHRGSGRTPGADPGMRGGRCEGSRPSYGSDLSASKAIGLIRRLVEGRPHGEGRAFRDPRG